jgi:hypothetical protein
LVAFSAGIAAGSIGVAPFYSAVGFEVALGTCIVACDAAGIVALLGSSDGPAVGREGTGHVIAGEAGGVQR